MAWRRFLHRKYWHQERSHEIEAYLEIETAENMARGMRPEEARYAARRKLGNATRIREEIYRMNSIEFLETLWQDVRFALRQLRKSPGFTAVAVITLALGIGANTAIFSIVDAVLLRPLPYPDPNQLVLIFDVPLKQSDALSPISYRDFTECREHNRVFSGMAGNAFHDLTLTGAGEPSIVNAAAVTPAIFPLLGAKPLAGRTLLPEDGKRGAAPVAVVSENLWRSRFGSNPALIGQSITLDMRSFTVVGILPASFRYPDGAPHQDVWISAWQDPLFGPLMSRPGVRVLAGIGRLKPGVSVAQAHAEMKALGARLAKEFPAQDSGFTIRIKPYRQVVVGNMKPALLI
ncbi:MAG: ABC transporter permease, partial [Terriglobia bacterium]